MQAEAIRGMTPAINSLIKQKADLTTQDNDGNTLLHYSAAIDSIEITKILLKAGVDPAAANRNGQIARELISQTNRDLVELFEASAGGGEG